MAYDEKQALSIFKARRNILPANTAQDEYFGVIIEAAEKRLEKEGIHIMRGDADDLMLLVNLASWMYANRDSNTGMPDWLRAAIRERWLNERDS